MKTSSRLLLPLVVLILTFDSVLSQKADSLIRLLPETEGVQKLQTYSDIAINFLLTKPDKAAVYAQQGLEEASRVDNTYYKGTFLGILGYANYMLSNVDDAIGFTKRSIQYFKETDSLIPLSKAYATLGSIFHKTGNYDDALTYMNLALSIHEKQHNERGKALTNLNIGVVYQSKDQPDQAINYFIKALTYFDSLPHNRNYYLLLMNTGMLYKQIDEYQKSLVYLLKSLPLVEASNNQRDMATCYMNLGITYKNLDSLDKARAFYGKADTISRGFTNQTIYGKIQNNLGVIELQKNNFQKAIKYFNQSLVVKKRYNDSMGLAVTYNYLADAYNKTGNKKLALELLGKAEAINKAKEFKKPMVETYKNYVDVYQSMGDYDNAFRYQTKEYELKHEIFNSEKFNQIAELETKYQTSKKEQEIQILNQQNDIKDLKLKKEQYTKVILAVVVIFLILISIVGYSRFVIKKRANRLLKKQKKQLDDYNEELNTANENLLTLNNNLEELNHTKDKFFSIISHDLKNPLGVLYATTDVLTRHFESFSKEKTKTYLENMNRSSRHLKNLLDNLLEWSQVQTGRLSIVKEPFDLHGVVANTLLVASNSASTKEINLQSGVKSGTFVYADKDMIATVVRNMVSNAIKFTPRGGTIKINVTEEENRIVVHVSDSGVGIPPNKMAGLFKINTTYKQPGTENEQGTGLGLILCKEFVEKNEGTIRVNSILGKGSTFSFSIPKGR